MKPSLYFTLGFITVLLVVSVGYVYFGLGRDENTSDIFNEIQKENSSELEAASTTPSQNESGVIGSETGSSTQSSSTTPNSVATTTENRSN
jgi:hypothetical protein